MPKFFDDALDEDPQLDACDGWMGGQVSNDRVSRLQINQAALLQNLDISREGVARTRRGSIVLGSAVVANSRIQGMIWYDHIEGGSQVQELFVFVNGESYVWNNSSWTVQTPTAVNAVNQVQIAQLLDKLYYVDGSSNVFSWDGTTDTDLGGGGATNPPAAASIIVSHANRLFVSGVAADPTAIHISGYDASWATSTNVISIGKGENDSITCLQPWSDFNLVVFKRHSTWIVGCNPFDGTTAIDIVEFPITQLHPTIGCVGPRASCQVGTDVWFLAQDGVHSVRRDVSGLNNEVSLPVSAQIQDIIDRITWAHADKSSAIFYENRFMLSVPLDGSSLPNYVLVYSTLTQSWSGFWTEWNPVCWAVIDFNDTQELVFGRQDGKVRRWLTHQNEAAVSTYQDDGIAIPTMLKTRGMICNEPMNPKQPFWIEGEWFNSEAPARVSLIADGTSSYLIDTVQTQNPVLTLPFTLPALLTPNGVRRVKKHIQHRPPFREMQVLMETDSGKVSHRAVFLAAFVDTYKLHDE